MYKKNVPYFKISAIRLLKKKMCREGGIQVFQDLILIKYKSRFLKKRLNN